MKLSSAPVLFALAFVGGVVALAMEPAGPVLSTDPILEIHHDSLRTYLPSSASGGQDIRPIYEQRGVNLDGSFRAGPSQGMRIAGNRFENAWKGAATVNGVRLDTGHYVVNDVDLSLPAEGFSWTIARSFNTRQETSGAAHRDSNGYQGKNWFQNSQPEIQLYEHPSDDAKDLVYLIYGADRFIELKRVDDTSDTFKATNGAAGVMLFEEGDTDEPDTYTLIDQNGNELVFFGFDADAGAATGQIWTITDPDANAAYVGDATTGSTAITNGYDSSGYITTAYDASDRRYTYTYTTLDSVDRLTKVEAETKTGGTWASPTGLATVGKVEYTYYSSESYGDIGDLKMVKRTIPMTDSGVEVVMKRYFRYWEGTYDVSSNPGYPHAIKYVIDYEGTRRQDWEDDDFDEDFLTLSNASLEVYASAYLEYDSSYRVDKAWFNGECGCSGGTNGTHEFTYGDNGSYSDNTSEYDEEWKSRAVVERPDGTYLTQYFDEGSQAISVVITASDPAVGTPDQWVRGVSRNTKGVVEKVHTPANLSSYTHSTGTISYQSSTGLVHRYTRVSSGIADGFLSAYQYRKGNSGTDYYIREVEYTQAELTTHGGTTLDKAIVRPLIDKRHTYDVVDSTDTGDRITTDYTPNVFSGTLAVSDRQAGYTAVGPLELGSGSATSETPYFDKDAAPTFHKAQDAIISYQETSGGVVTKRIEDADTGETGSGEDFENVTIPGGLSSTAGAFHRVTTYAYDAQGRAEETTRPDGLVSKTYRSKLADGRFVTLTYSDYETSPSTKFYGPVQYSVTNHAGKVEAQGVVALTSNESTTALTGHVDETDDDPITAIDFGTLARLTTSHYNETGGTLEESRLYFDIPASGVGTDGTNYDPTLYGYDDMGRRWRVKEASGTIRRTSFDERGQTLAQYIGTNDSTFSGGEASGTDNMVKTQEQEYDSAADDGNGLVTKRTTFVEDSATDKRETTYEYDHRGNLLLETRPESPHLFHKYDNKGRRVATGFFSSTASIVTSSDDPTTETSNRVGLSQTFYNELGQAYKTQRHEIDQSDGSDDNDLPYEYTFDETGRTIMVDGHQLTKTFYDRLGRQTHQFILADDNDTAYADADDVTGDNVLEEYQTVYESEDADEVLMRVVIQRYHDDDSGTGALDSNADSDDLKLTIGNLDGRAQITAYWYDRFGRLEDSVRYGTYGEATFDRDGLSVPTRSDTALRTSYSYATSGNQEAVTDPRDLVARTEYDDAGRVTRRVRNYDVTVNSGNPSGSDDNQTVTYEYTDGLQTKITADLPSGQTDQETTYTYGTTKGASAGDSEIASGHLLQEVEYPDSASASDVVSYAYNAQSELIWKEDQAGNVIETDRDDQGREEHRRITTLASGYDGRVRRISTTYSDRGMVELVTQYDNATVGSGSVKDEVKQTYDGWGVISQYEQDRNSAVGASGSVDDYEVSYTNVRSLTGRNSIRRKDMTLPSGNVIDYKYGTGIDGDANRVYRIKDGETTLVDYEYLGVSSVVEVSHVLWASTRYGSTSGEYPDLDRFNRVASDRWTSSLGATDTDYYDVDITYDRNSNITLTEDNVHVGFDVSYTIDDLDRLDRADQGTWGGSSISSSTHDQDWTLDHLANWDQVTLDLDDSGTFTGTDEYDDDRTHNDFNELTGRDTDDNGTDDFTLTYDATGSLTDDGESYKYEYDALIRLRKVKDQSDNLVSEYYYNGLGHMISVHQDTDDDSDVDGSDLWYHRAYDERGRMLGTFREDDFDPKEEFLPHQAGLDGLGGASHSNTVVVRDKDANTAWTSASDGVLEQRWVYCANRDGDQVVLVDHAGRYGESDRYSSYGTPFGIPGADTDSDGDRDSTDVSQIDTWINASAYDVRGDVDLDGDVNTTDKALATAAGYLTLGLGELGANGNAYGHASRQWDHSVRVAYDLDGQVLSPALGKWHQRQDRVEWEDQYAATNRQAPLGKPPIASRHPQLTDHQPSQGEVRMPAPTSSNLGAIGPQSQRCGSPRSFRGYTEKFRTFVQVPAGSPIPFATLLCRSSLMHHARSLWDCGPGCPTGWAVSIPCHALNLIVEAIIELQMISDNVPYDGLVLIKCEAHIVTKWWCSPCPTGSR